MTPSHLDQPGHRVSLPTGIGIWPLYGPAFAVGHFVADVGYADLAASADNMVRALVQGCRPAASALACTLGS